MEKWVGRGESKISNVEVNHIQVLDQEMLLLKFYNNNFHIPHQTTMPFLYY